MKNDYLFDGTGADAEIEKLEDLLSGYRYAETDPPELPAMNIIHPFERVPWRRRLGLILTFGAATTALVLVAMYVNTTRVVPVSEPEIVKTNEPEVKIVQPATNETTPSVTRPEVVDSRTNATASRPLHAKFRSSKPRLPKAMVATQKPVILTAEEQYAYNQVKLALFITGSKLRTVSDAVENRQDNSPKNNR